MKKIFAIIGSASKNSSNLRLVIQLAERMKGHFDFQIFDRLSDLPHFDPARCTINTPQPILDFRKSIEEADGVLICTPEYVFSIPSGLKNAIEWCVSTTVFSKKRVGLITAAASGEKGHEELQLIMKTIEADFNDRTTWLIQGIKGRIKAEGTISDVRTRQEMEAFIEGFGKLILRSV